MTQRHWKCPRKLTVLPYTMFSTGFRRHHKMDPVILPIYMAENAHTINGAQRIFKKRWELIMWTEGPTNSSTHPCFQLLFFFTYPCTYHPYFHLFFPFFFLFSGLDPPLQRWCKIKAKTNNISEKIYYVDCSNYFSYSELYISDRIRIRDHCDPPRKCSPLDL